LSLDNQYAHTKVYYPKRQLSSLTGREIEEMFTATEPTKTRNQTPPKITAEEWFKGRPEDWNWLTERIGQGRTVTITIEELYDFMNEFAKTHTTPQEMDA